jgi:hypothetical protein
MPESPRKRSTPAAKAAKTNDETVAAKSVKAKAVKAEDEPKAAKAATKKATNAVAPARADEVVVPAEPAKKATKAAKKAATEPVEPPAEVPAAEPQTGDDEPEFLNRAARRAKGRKGGAQQPVLGGGPTFAGRGAVPGQRQYGTRRTGG